MGWLGSSRTTTVQTNTTPKWVEGAVQEGLAAGRVAAGRNFVPYQQERVAGFDPMEVLARDAAMNQAGAWQPGLNAAGAATMAGVTAPVRDVQTQTVQAPSLFAPRLGPAATMDAAGPTQVATAAPAATAQAGMAAYENPFQSQVIDATTREIRRQADTAHAALGQRAAAQGAMGGTREQLLRGEIERNAQVNTADAVGRLALQGFDRAAQFGAADADRGQQTGLFNASALNSAREAFAGRTQQAGLANMDARNTQNRDRARMQLEAAMARAGMSLDAQRTSGEFSLRAQTANQGADAAFADRALRGGSLFGDLSRLRSQLGLADVATLQGLGSEGRLIDQARLDAGYGEFMREQDWADERTRMLLASIYGAPFSLWSSSTNNTRSSDPARGLSAVGSFIQGVGGLFGGGRGG